MKLSLSIGNREFSIGAEKKSVSSLAAWMRGEDDTEASGAQLVSAYQQSTWVYACVSAIAQQVAQIPFRFSRAEKLSERGSVSRSAASHRLALRRKAMGETIVESGPVVELFNRPHPQLDRFQFWELLVTWLQLRGEFFAVPMDNSFTLGVERPTMLAILAPESFQERVTANMLEGWRYSGSGQQSPAPTLDLIPEDVITHRLPNPFDFWRGMSPLTVARLAASSDYASAQFERGLMMNNADTGVIVTTDQQVDEAQREAMLAALKARKRSAGTADRPLFMWGGAKIEKPTISSADLQFLEGRRFKRQELCVIFKTAQEILGINEDANRAVGGSVRLNWIENTIAPMCERIEAALDPFIKRMDAGLYGWFDIEALPIMQSARRERYAGAVSAFGMGVPINDCSEIFDLGLPDDLPHAGKSFLPFSLQEVGGKMEDGTDPEDGGTPAPAPAEQNIFERASGLLKLLSKPPSSILHPPAAPHQCAPNPEYEASIAGSVKIKVGTMRKFFFEQRGRVLAALAEENRGLKMEDGNPPSSIIDPQSAKALDDVFNQGKENEILLGKLKAKLIADLQFGGAQLFQEIGAGQFNLPPAEALAFLDKRKNPIENINAVTWESLKAELQAGIAAGEGYSELSGRVKMVYSDASERRADTIAFTETNVAVNSGRYEAMQQARVERKGWRTSKMEGTRQSHKANEDLSSAQNGIPIAERWPNGLLYPGDPAGSPGETINCRCFGFALASAGKGAGAPRGALLRFEEWWVAALGTTKQNGFAMGPGRFAMGSETRMDTKEHE